MNNHSQSICEIENSQSYEMNFINKDFPFLVKFQHVQKQNRKIKVLDSVIWFNKLLQHILENIK